MAMMTSGTETQKFGDPGLAIERLRDNLEASRAEGLEVHDPGILTFAALRVVGPAGTVLVSAGYWADGKVVFLAPPVDEVSGSGVCDVIGTPDRIGEVAGILRYRVAVGRA